MSKVKALAVFRGGKQHGVILQDDVADFINSLFTQPNGTNIQLVRVDVDSTLIGAPVTARKSEPVGTASKIDQLVGKSG